MSRAKKTTKLLTGLSHGIFPGATALLMGYTYEEALKDLSPDWRRCLDASDRSFFENSAGACLHREVISTDKSGKESQRINYYFLILRDFNFTDKDFVILAHELLHLCQFFLPSVNVERDKEIECEAYFHTHMMTQALEEIRKAKSKRKN